MPSSLTQVAILIPAYQPLEPMLAFLRELSREEFQSIVIVNDGSGEAYEALFEAVALLPHVTVLTHATNQGKGAALKTGFNYIAERFPEVVGIVTADADGQHALPDIRAVAQALMATPHQLVLGERAFGGNVPLRSKFGNLLTNKLFGWCYRSKIRDTQTGLRGIPLALAKQFLSIPYDRYEFEFECLIEAVDQGVKIHSVNIQTIYIDNNASSHFRPVKDSLKIYFVFFRYTIIAFISFLIDLAIFVGFNWWLHNILLSLFIARMSSSAFNFFQNKFIVYRSKDKTKIQHEITKYLILAVLIFCWSYMLISIFHLKFGIGVVWSKIIGDVILFCISFLIQKYYVFK